MTASANPTLLSIIAHVRSGALGHAQRLFREAGFDRIDNDSAVLCVRGRLLKDRARSASGMERKRFYLEAADAYVRAAKIGGETYPLINAATLSLLAGNKEQARKLARQILARCEDGATEPETPYWRAATLAEAHLLLGNAARARADFGKAVSLAPRAFEDHASTLRQFVLILDALGEDKGWLDPLRPPRSLHFAGHMALPQANRTLARQIRMAIVEERVGFGYGALAAGADILIADALLEAGAELHLILPAEVSAFRDASVARFGADWATRFDQIVKHVSSIRIAGSKPHSLSPLAIRLAAEISMGSAVMLADTLMTEAVQVLILERSGTSAPADGVSSMIGAGWLKNGRRQRVLAAPRIRADSSLPAEQCAVASERLAAMLRIDLSGADPDKLAKETLPLVAQLLALGDAPAAPPRWTGEAVIVAFDAPDSAARTAVSIAATLEAVHDLRIAGHYSIVHLTEDPFGGPTLLTGGESSIPSQILLSTPSGAIHVSEDFAATLSAGPAGTRPRIEFVGELPTDDIGNPIRLYSLRG